MTSELFRQALDYIHTGGWLMGPLILLFFCIWMLILKKSLEIFQLHHKDKVRHQENWRLDLFHLLRTRQPEPKRIREIALQIARIEFDRRVRSGIRTILVLASVAPLLGLLGTVTGMITTFEAVARFGAGNTRALAAGLSEAMITTQTGLVVAVPGLMAGYFLKRRADRFCERMERYGMILLREHGEKIS